MPKTKEEILAEHSHIPTSDVKKDLQDTERDIKDLQDELDVLNRNPVDNKLRIYMSQGKILKREKFVSYLDQLLEYRGES